MSDATSPAEPVAFHRHAAYNSFIGVMVTLATVLALIALFSGPGGEAPVADRELFAPVLTPKAALPVIQAVEGENWTRAPEVPPAVSRDGQAKIVVDWRATEFVGELDPASGLQYSYWGFENSVPGPVLRARQGDLIEIRLTNALKNKHPHNIDFHFSNGPGGGASALNVSPGQTGMVQLRALAPGIYMYHCATPDIPTHIANGMYGFVIIDPEDGLPPVDREFYVVQSEFYPDRQGKKLATLDLASVDAEEPEYVVFNGAAGSLLGDGALSASVGDRVRIWFGNAGPNLISSFHVIGEIFDRVYREGSLVSPPALSVQTTLVPAGGATVVEFTIDVPGTYLLVDHAISRALHKGAAGAIVAEGSDDAEIFAPGLENPAPPAGEDPHGSPAPAGSTPVSITEGAFDQANADRAYDPIVVEVDAGTTITWTNDDFVAHTVTADNDDFDSGFLNEGETWSRKFSNPGTYAYHCIPHPWMKAMVIVS